MRYRSRTEARWAMFFAKIGWPAEYEPLDLDGYIPDFIVAFDFAPLLVEVKPAVKLVDLEPDVGKIVRSGWSGEALLVGSMLFDTWKVEGPTLGLFVERDEGELAPPDSAQSFRCSVCKTISVYPLGGRWRCRSCGIEDRNAREWIGSKDLVRLFAEAGREVQWRGER